MRFWIKTGVEVAAFLFVVFIIVVLIAGIQWAAGW
jgi:heme/copper-type cytochrome/quinol oxidase subunit 4